MWFILGILLLIGWLAGVFVFEIAGWVIHLLLIAAIISVLIRIIRGA